MEIKKEDLPACPVETTLSLIGDKWKVLILRDLMPGTKRFGELKKSSGYGGKRPDQQKSICRSSAQSGIFAHRSREKPETHFRRNEKLG